MSWIPVFSLGLWNAWILMLIIPLEPVLLRLVDKAVGSGDIYKKMGEAPTDKTEKRVNAAYTAILYLLLAYSVFLPLKLGTPWFYAGLAIYLAGLGMLLAAIVNAAAAPAGRLFTRGMYRISRHPLYVSTGMIFIGVGIASAAWVFLLLALILIILLALQAESEERDCLRRFGDEYRDYMHMTPRWLGIPKSH